MAIELSLLGTYATGIFDESAAEIPAYDPATQQLFVTNGDTDAVDVLSISDPTTPTLAASLDVSTFGGGVQSVAVSDGIVAVAVAAADDAAAGSVVFFSTAGQQLGSVTVGVLPDALTFTPDGTKIVVANEGEPVLDANNVLLSNPVGSISIIDIAGGVASATATTLGFDAFVGQEVALRAAGVRIAAAFTAAQDFEPEFPAISPDGTTAYVTLQENNAVAVVDLNTSTITGIQSLGTVDFSSTSALDPSNEDSLINIANFPVAGFRQADAIATYEVGGQVYYVTANEGDGRDDETARVAEITLDPTVFPNAATLQLEENLGRLEVSTVNGDIDNDGDFDELYAYGGRSFSIFSADGTLVFDSGAAFEQITAAEFPEFFNSTNDESVSIDDRSDDAGPEPEGITIGEINDVPYAFIGLERIGGVMVYDISDPTAAEFVQYINTRDISGDPEAGTAGDLGPEGLVFISAEDSPTGIPLLAVTNEVSGTTSIFSINAAPDITPTLDTFTTFDIDVTLVNVNVNIVQVNQTFEFTGSNEVNIIVSTVDIDIINAGGGSDVVICGGGNDQVDGGDGDDTIDCGDGDDEADGGSGDDDIHGGSGNDQVDGGDGDDTIDCGDGDDEADGGNGSDVIRGKIGIDIIIGGNGKDNLFGGAGDDDCSGDGGQDFIYGGAGDDTIDGGNQGDTLRGGVGIDIIIGGNGKDNIRGGSDDDEITGDNGRDNIFCGSGDDSAEGGSATDFINAGSGDDEISGDDGDDILIGGSGNDMVVGGDHDDTLRGGEGDDMLFGGNGRDICIGGSGNDTFVLEVTTLFNVVRDFEIGIDFFGLSVDISFEELSFVQVGVDTVVSHESGTLAVVQNVEATLITTEEFFVTVDV
ncbi:MAG: hypothetical protein F6K30_17725 [Cyanothece sp. SIO2G6]|nr:hypothetical protein [Cyanothece sp. SIO2G6]